MFTTKNGVNVVVSKETMEHMKAHIGVDVNHIKEAVARIEYNGPFFMEEVNLERTIGKDNCVPTAPGDDVRLLYRKGRKGRTPIVFNKTAADTSVIVIGICDDDENDNIPTLFTAFYGRKAPREPWDTKSEEEKDASMVFWTTHALVYNPDELDEERNSSL